ncbi:hypothetical protein [Actomonas aquatica]|uniref:Lipoprotein SmpA/OmlA domain-containing protein n=1 Tax=Actomonas aquatica TaxID=2866162 RepID=A0ABZ1CHA5_9BACT|nr:hypothetical protein [Opitutus sp. WL0086]WRQ89964.1 hypothetical protein K1X11_011145 [Opitutus sp. WL0086]
MNTTRTLLPVLAAAGLLLSTGCASFESRTEEKAYVFNSLPVETKQRLEEGEIHIGDTPDMVYIDLGEPSDKRSTVTADGQTSTWIYASYSREYEGENFVGYRRVVTRDSLIGGYRVAYVPVSESIYSENVDERFRVTFRDGSVTAIETNA